MLKAVSSITNAIGAVNYKGLWNASTNSPTLTSGAGTTGDYYIVSTAGSTSIDGTSTWYVGDWIVFNGTTWQRLQGGADDPAPSVKSNSTTGLMQVTGPAAGATRVVTIPDANATMARTDAAQSFTGNQTLATGNLIIGTAGKGIDFSADSNAAGMTSELFADYEEGTWTPTNTSPITINRATYTKIGRQVTCWLEITVGAGAATVGDMGGLPFASVRYSGGFVNYHTENATTTYTVFLQPGTTWSFRLGSAQQQFSASKDVLAVITYYV